MVLGKNKVKHGEDFLASIRALSLTLDNGSRADFRLAEEIHIPDARDGMALSELAVCIPGRLAFWGHQLNRAKQELRRATLEYKKLEARKDWTYRALIDSGEYDSGDSKYSSRDFNAVQSRLSMDREIISAREGLDLLQTNVDRVESLYSALSQMSFIVTRLLGAMTTADKRA